MMMSKTTYTSLSKRSLVICCATITLLVPTKAQSNTDDITFPTTASVKQQKGKLKSGIYLMSTITDEGKEIFVSSVFMKDKKGLKTDSLTQIDTNRISVENNKCLWEFIVKSDSTLNIRSTKEGKYLFKAESSADLSYDKGNKIWKYSILSNGKINIFTEDRTRILSRDYMYKNGFKCYAITNSTLNADFSLYTLSPTSSKGTCTMPQQGQRLCFVANDEKLKATSGNDIDKEGLLLNDGTVASAENLLVLVAEVLSNNTLQLKTTTGQYCNYDLQSESSPSTWKICNGHLCTNESPTRYLCYDNGTWTQKLEEEADNMVNLQSVATEAEMTTSENGVVQLKGGWSAAALSAINFDGIRCLDLTAISLPAQPKAFQNRNEGNLPIFVNSKEADLTPTSWSFVVSCNGSQNILQDNQLILTDKKPFYTDRNINITDNQVIYQRTSGNSDSWQTLSLPFAATVTKGKLYDCTDIEGETLNFSEVKYTEQSKGYLAKPSSDGVLLLKSKACTIAATTTSSSSILHFNNEALTISDGNYYLLHPGLQKFIHAKEGSTLAPFRAYLKLDGNKKLGIRISK